MMHKIIMGDLRLTKKEIKRIRKIATLGKINRLKTVKIDL